MHAGDLEYLIVVPYKAPPSRNGTDGRVYGGDKNLIHIPDGKRAAFGDDVAGYVDERMRRGVMTRNERTLDEALFQKLCPGCYMVAGFNALVQLAIENGQPLSELANSMCEAFKALAAAPDPNAATIESISVVLDRAGER